MGKLRFTWRQLQAARRKREAKQETNVLPFAKRRVQLSVGQLATAVAAKLGEGATLTTAVKTVAKATGYAPVWVRSAYLSQVPMEIAA